MIREAREASLSTGLDQEANQGLNFLMELGVKTELLGEFLKGIYYQIKFLLQYQI